LAVLSATWLFPLRVKLSIHSDGFPHLSGICRMNVSTSQSFAGKLTIANEKERGHEELGNRTSY
jgi:hypothetical protein